MPGLSDLGGLADQLRQQEEAARRKQLATQPRENRGGEAAKAAVERQRRRRSSAAPEAKPGFNLDSIRDAFTPWEQRSGGTDFWEGMSERQALNKADGVHRAYQRGEITQSEIQKALNFTDEETRSFAAFANSPRNVSSKTKAFGVPHAAGQENMWATLMTESGNPTQSLSGITGDPQVTDLIGTIQGNERLIDVQNIMYPGSGEQRITLPFLKNLRRGNAFDGINAFREADNDDTLRKIIQRVTKKAGQRLDGYGANYGIDKILQARNFEDLDIGLPDGDMKNLQRRSTYAKDILMGGIYDVKNAVNLTGNVNHGTYNPQLPKVGHYAIDLDKTRGLLDVPKRELVDMGGEILDKKGKLALRMPLEQVQLRSGGRGFFKELVNSPVMQAARRISSNPAFRMAGVAVAGVPILGDAVDASTGTYDAVTKKGDERVRGVGNAGAGLTGLAALAAPAAAPVLAPISAGLGIGNALADNAKERRENSSALTINSDKAENRGAFIHTEAAPVTIQAPTARTSRWADRRRNRRSS